MPELRLVLIIVGALAIAALLLHGLWTSKKEEKRKFAEQSVKGSERAGDISDDGFEVIKKQKPKSAPGIDRSFSHDPLGGHDPLDTVSSDKDLSGQEHHSAAHIDREQPKVTLPYDVEDALEEKVIFSDGEDEITLKPKQAVKQPVAETSSEREVASSEAEQTEQASEEPLVEETPVTEEQKEPTEEDVEVIVLHVHCAGEEPFVGTQLFDSMQQNGLLYGDMDIFHRHNDMSGTGKVLFSVANMMQPGTLEHDDPETFTTKGISFFMMLPCFGEAEQNFKLMLKTAQQIADDLGANVLDDQRNLMTPNKLANYRNQIRSFNARQDD